MDYRTIVFRYALKDRFLFCALNDLACCFIKLGSSIGIEYDFWCGGLTFGSVGMRVGDVA